MVTLLTGKIFCLFKGYHGCSIGKAKQAAKTEIEKLKVRMCVSCRSPSNSFLLINFMEPRVKI